nr:hypothetical protein [Myxococcota bacterium]
GTVIAPAFDARIAPVLGRPCATTPDAGQRCWLCDASGAIVGAVLPGDHVHVDLSSAGVVHAGGGGAGAGPRTLTYAVAVEAGGLRAQILTCPGCRRQLGWGLEITASGWSALGPTLRSELLVSLGYPAGTLALDQLRGARPTAPSASPIACPAGSRR